VYFIPTSDADFTFSESTEPFDGCIPYSGCERSTLARKSSVFSPVSLTTDLSTVTLRVPSTVLSPWTCRSMDSPKHPDRVRASRQSTPARHSPRVTRDT
jgi:hypothetical protein